MKCILLFAALAFVVYVECSGSEEFKCQLGVPYIENDCNTCVCSQSGSLGCTRQECIGQKHRDLEHCQVGSTSKNDCNDCVCVKNLGTICTNKKC